MSWLDRIDEKQAGRLVHTLNHAAAETRDLAQDRFTQFAQQARGMAEPALHQAADYARHEGEIVVRAAAKQAARAGRAVRADPVPAIVGIVGLALFANLVFGRRRS